jgi:mono/diheme cytochrome c family protein
MKNVLKIVAGLLGVLILGIIVVVLGLYFISNSDINKTYSVSAAAVEVPNDEETLALGQHLAESRGCTDCHGDNFAGGPFFNDGAMGTLYASNLTSGPGGIGGSYSDADWVLAIRHGIGPDKKPLLFMPSHEFWNYSDRDLGAMVAYLKTLPPVENQVPEASIGPVARALYLSGQLPLIPAELIDHTGPRPDAPEPGVTVAYGKYLATAGCVGCHGETLSGGPIPGVPPEWPAGANLTPGGNLADYTEEDFITTLRTGVTPIGYELPAEFMPWPTLGKMTDEELQALWLYLESVPARPTGQR